MVQRRLLGGLQPRTDQADAVYKFTAIEVRDSELLRQITGQVVHLSQRGRQRLDQIVSLGPVTACGAGEIEAVAGEGPVSNHTVNCVDSFNTGSS